MKKLFILLVVGLFPVWAGAEDSLYQKFVFQKQLVMDDAITHQISTCQAFFIHENWLATSAHCVEHCNPQVKNSCRVKVLLAQGDVNASVHLTEQDVFIPQEYRTIDVEKRVRSYQLWDIALLHYQPQEFLYEFPEGGNATQTEFEQALREDWGLQQQWNWEKQIPVLHTYQGPDLMMLKQNLFVPRWNWGELEMFSDPNLVLYFGKNAFLWGADGFGVDHGNSGGAVCIADGSVVGIATSKVNNTLPAEARQAFPKFGQASDFFLFTGFAPKTTLKFIQNTMLKFGDRPRTKKLKRVRPVIEP